MYIFLFSCTSCPDISNQLPGKYFFNEYGNDSDVDIIELFDDNSYTHTFLSKRGQVFENSGKWEFNSLNCEILFSDFIFYNKAGPVFGSLGGNWYSRVRLEEDRIKLMYSSENNIYYNKKNNF